jgi:predicted nucleic acid-binding protein
LIHYIRRSAVFQHVESRYDPFGQGNNPLVSVIAVGELKSFAFQMKWGKEKWKELQQMLGKFVKIDIRYGVLDDRYAAIDAFSQNKLPEKPLGLTARNMGKNDLWLAATASVLGAKLLTTDSDFDRLDGVFLDLEKIFLP